MLLRPRSPVPRAYGYPRGALTVPRKRHYQADPSPWALRNPPVAPTGDHAQVCGCCANAGQPPAWQAQGSSTRNRTDASFASGSAWVSAVSLLTLAAALIFGLQRYAHRQSSR